MSTHTHGPWAILDLLTLSEGEGIERLTIVAPGAEANCVIARIENIVSKRPISIEDRANARLIAAAPELLAALEMYVKWCDAESDHKGSTFYERVDMCVDAETAARAAIAKAKS